MIISHQVQNYKTNFEKWKNTKIEEGFEWEGSTFQIDATSMMFIHGKLQEITLLRHKDIHNKVFYWRTADNKFHEFSAESFTEFYLAVVKHVSSLLEAVWVKKDKHIKREKKTPK